MLIDKVPMIRAVRELSQCGLREAKLLVEYVVRNNPNEYQFVDNYTASRPTHDAADARKIVRDWRAFFSDCSAIQEDTKNALLVDPELTALVAAMRKVDIATIDIAKVLDNLGRWSVEDIKCAANADKVVYGVTHTTMDGWRYL